MASAVGHVVGEFIKNNALENLDINNLPFDPNNPNSIQQYVDDLENKTVAIASAVGGATVLLTQEGVTAEELDRATALSESVVENNVLCGGMCIVGIVTAIAAYTTAVGEGDPLDGLQTIGKGDDPLSKAVATGSEATVTLLAEEYPEQTQATLEVLGAMGDGIEATVTYIDEATGEKVSTAWNNLDKSTRNGLKGAGKILSIVVPGGTVGKIGAIKKLQGKDFNKINANGTKYINPKTAKINTITSDVTDKFGNIQKDHIFPKKEIERLPGWNDLTKSDQKEILNMKENLQPLPQRLNASKSNKVQGTDNEWTEFKSENMPIHPKYRNALKDAQNSLKNKIQDDIKRRLNK